MYVTYHVDAANVPSKGIELPIETFNNDVRTLAKERGHHDRTWVKISNNYYYTFLHFNNRDRIDIKRN